MIAANTVDEYGAQSTSATGSPNSKLKTGNLFIRNNLNYNYKKDVYFFRYLNLWSHILTVQSAEAEINTFL